MNILKVLTPKRRVGNLGEDAAVKFLKKSGYKILARSYEGAGHEIDIVAEAKGVTVFVEVKARNVSSKSKKEPRPASSVTPRKQRGIIAAAKHYCTFHLTEGPIQFDVIEVYLEGDDKDLKVKEIKHLKNTFNFNTAYSRTRRI